ncbi:MAG: hypothetical protein VXZ72_04285 [Chlamydiota bacterium]|nr:hypothetical protein [Chlamydiota bacterium]
MKSSKYRLVALAILHNVRGKLSIFKDPKWMHVPLSDTTTEEIFRSLATSFTNNLGTMTTNNRGQIVSELTIAESHLDSGVYEVLQWCNNQKHFEYQMGREKRRRSLMIHDLLSLAIACLIYYSDASDRKSTIDPFSLRGSQVYFYLGKALAGMDSLLAPNKRTASLLPQGMQLEYCSLQMVGMVLLIVAFESKKERLDAEGAVTFCSNALLTAMQAASIHNVYQLGKVRWYHQLTSSLWKNFIPFYVMKTFTEQVAQGLICLLGLTAYYLGDRS